MKRFLFLFLAFATVRGLLGSGNTDSIRDSRLLELQKGENEMSNEAQCRAPEPIAGPDREVWIRNQVLTAMEMALALRAKRTVRADEDAFQGGMRGVAEGASIEILRILGFSTHNLVNLRGAQHSNIASLEKILQSEEHTPITVNRDGSISAG